MEKITKILDKFTNIVGYIAAVAMVLMLFNVAYDVIMRYFLKACSIGMQELEWHLFSIVFLFGMAYTLKEDGHVRVDMLYEKMKPKKQAIINIVGALIFIIPFSLLIVKGGFAFALESYNLGEISSDPGGLTYRWIIKATIVLSFIFLIVSTISFILHNIQTIVTNKKSTTTYKHLEEIL